MDCFDLLSVRFGINPWVEIRGRVLYGYKQFVGCSFILNQQIPQLFQAFFVFIIETVGECLFNRSVPGDDEKFIVSVLNNPGVELPATGGSGTGLLYLMGILLTALAGAGLVLMNSRRADG